MASIAENLRATLLSLKQISDRVKSLVTTSVTKSEATADKNAILSAIGNIPAPDLSSVSKESQTKDGNDTAISVAKDVRNELGTGSDTAAETGTLFAVLKWTKNKVKDIYNAITDSTNGLSAIKTSAASAATDAAAAKVAAQSLTSLESDINAGKTAIATAITAKGVTTSPTQSMSVMAQNISSITQETIEIDGGDMYAKQLFGSLATPNYWNLYEVMAYLLTKTSSEQYSILLCEFPKGDAQYVFGTAVSTGSIPVGYVFSDDWQLNGEGSLNIHANTESSHVWNDNLDMKGNRWVAWLFAQVLEGATAPTVSLGASETNCPQPRSIHIGRHIGTITATANGVLSEIVVTDGNVLDGFVSGTYTQGWGKKTILRTRNVSGNLLALAAIESIYVSVENISSGSVCVYGGSYTSMIIIANDVQGKVYQGVTSSYLYLQADKIKLRNGADVPLVGNAPKKIVLILNSTNNDTGNNYIFGNHGNKLEYLYLGYKEEAGSIVLGANAAATSLLDIELQDGYLKNLSLGGNYILTNALTAENIALHMLDRLGTCTAETGQLTLKIGQTNLTTIQNDSTYSSYLTEATTTKGWAVIA